MKIWARKFPRVVRDRCAFLASLVRGKTVLDIGCIEHDMRLVDEHRKRGRWLHERLRETAKSVVGLDYEANPVKLLNERGYNMVVGDATDFDLGKHFDVIVAGHIIEHISNPEGFFKSVRKHMGPDSLFVVTTPNATNIFYFLETLFLGREYDSDDHICLYTPTTLQAFLIKCGFRTERILFIQESTSYYHTRAFLKFLAMVKQLFGVTLGFLFPAICQQFICMARLSDAEIPGEHVKDMRHYRES